MNCHGYEQNVYKLVARGYIYVPVIFKRYDGFAAVFR
jgi:hypothetical protein